MLTSALSDLSKSVLSWRLWMLLGWLEIRQRYARSSLGPFWLTVSMAVMIGSIGAVYGTLFRMQLREYLPFLSISLILWGTFSSIVSEGSIAYINSSAYIRQAATPKLIYILQAVWRNLVILAHNFVIVVILLAIFGVKSWSSLPLFIPAFIIYVLNAMWVGIVAATLSARFRDFPQIISALLQVMFYITPIMYRPESLSRFAWVVYLNPMAYFMNLVRNPLIGQIPPLSSWGVCAGITLLGWVVALLLTGRCLNRIPYWV